MTEIIKIIELFWTGLKKLIPLFRSKFLTKFYKKIKYIKKLKIIAMSKMDMKNLSLLNQWHLSLKNEILNKLTNIESALPNTRVLHLEELIELEKNKNHVFKKIRRLSTIFKKYSQLY